MNENVQTHMISLIIGNSRGYTGDVLITELSRVLGIPTVAELLALHPDPGILIIMWCMIIYVVYVYKYRCNPRCLYWSILL